MSKLELYEPFTRNLITQGFAENAATYYKDNGLIGHPAIDYGVTCGTPIRNCIDGAFVYSLLNRENPDLTKYRAVLTLKEVDGIVYEYIYGHMDRIDVSPGQILPLGAILGTSGNTGEVWSNGVKVTKHRPGCPGGHLHAQLRTCKKVKKTTKGKQYLVNGLGIYKWDGYYLEILDFKNGTSGCVNPMDYYNGLLVPEERPKYFPFSKDLYIGITDKEVVELQRFLNGQKFLVATFGAGSPGKETTYFGSLTQDALRRFQLAKGINPPAGFFGNITRTYISKLS